MVEISNWRKGMYPKKYTVSINGKDYSFGDVRYQQYEDRTPLKLYSHLDHYDENRRRLYRLRHQHNDGVAGKLSQFYLW